MVISTKASQSGMPDGGPPAAQAIARLIDRPPPQIFEPRLRLRRFLSIALLCALSVVLLWVSFPPFGLWWAAYVALVPWAMAVAPGVHGRWQVLFGWLAGVLWWSGNLNWLIWITPGGYLAAVVYLSVYWLIATLALRAAVRRNWPIWLVLPILWTGLEFAWSNLIAFPWFTLAQTQHTQVRLIQIADTTGQYGVSFFVAMVNGALVDLLITPLFKRNSGSGGAVFRTRIVTGVAVAIVAAAALLGYGTFRLGQQATHRGPRIGIVQHSFGISLDKPDARAIEMFQAHIESTDAFIGRGCDLVVWPETMLVPGLNDAYINYLSAGDDSDAAGFKTCRAEVAQAAAQVGCPILAGGLSGQPPARGETDIQRYNSALLFDRTGRQLARYDKRHLVPFSEYVPFSDTWPSLHGMLRAFVPPSMPQITPGTPRPPMRLERPGGQWNLVTPICFEGTIPSLCRSLVLRDGEKIPNLIMVNLSNDGWFVYQRYVGHIPGRVAQAPRGPGATAAGGRVIFEATDEAPGDISPETKLLIHRGSLWIGSVRVVAVEGTRLVVEVDYARTAIEPGDRLCRSVRMYHSTEQAQHMAHYVFRAIENRVPVVRSVNTGISASIDSSGRVQSVLERQGRRVMVVGTMIVGSPDNAVSPGGAGGASIYGGNVLVDDRVTLYSQFGDVFAVCICAAAVVLPVMSVLRSRQRKEETLA